MSPPKIVGGSPSPFFRGVVDPAEAQKYLDLLKAHGVTDIDCARRYRFAEQNFAALKYADQGFIMDTKIQSYTPHAHAPENVHASMKESLEILGTQKVHILYLHAPDRATPWEDTLRAINEIYQEGKFEKFGLSNYKAEEVAEILAIADRHGWIRPSVYQGNYNPITRRNEEELFPLLRKENIAFYAYSPLAGGFFSGNVTHKDQQLEPGSRFDWLESYRKHYFKDSYFKALEEYLSFVKAHNLSPLEVPLRWIKHHSLLSGEHGDAIIIGASRYEHFEDNLNDLEKGPLPPEVTLFLEDLWQKIKHDAPVIYY